MKLVQVFCGLCFVVTIVVGMKIENHLIDITPSIRKVPTSQKVVALTFDDGPLSPSTPQILAILKEKDVKATFFVVGERVKQFPALVRQEVAEGHEVGSHTFSHPKLTIQSKKQIANEIISTEKVISEVAPQPNLFRPPGGFYNDTILQLARDRGYLIILWSIDTDDWRYPPVGDIVNSAIKDIKPGSIILLHDGKYPSSTPEALGFIIDSLKSRGYEFVTVSELLQYYEEKP